MGFILVHMYPFWLIINKIPNFYKQIPMKKNTAESAALKRSAAQSGGGDVLGRLKLSLPTFWIAINCLPTFWVASIW